jgi:Tfp pilus assembly protein PilO
VGSLQVDVLLTEKRKRWLMVAWLLGLLALAVPSGADRSIQHIRTLGPLRAELLNRSQLPERARRLSESVARKKNEVSHLEDLLVPADELPGFKQMIARMVRTRNCHLRSMRPGSITRRPLDERLGRATLATAKASQAQMWEVEEQQSILSVEGGFSDLLKFISDLSKQTRLLEMASLDLHPVPHDPSRLILDLHITTFDLLRQG